MEKMLYGSQSWSKVERQFWILSIAGSVVWILYVLIFEIVLFFLQSSMKTMNRILPFSSTTISMIS